MKSRRRAREAVLQALYQCDTLADWSRGSIQLYFKQFQDALVEDAPFAESQSEYREFALLLAEGVCTHREQVDQAIARASTHWSLPRMARVDRNILRLAVYELLFHKEVPVGVVINEAIEIAKAYSSADTPMFVNGVLDHVAKELALQELVDAEPKKMASNG